MLPAVQSAPPPYLGADPGGGIAEGEDGHVLRPAQPVHGDLGAGGPLDHGDVVLPESTRCMVGGDAGPSGTRDTGPTWTLGQRGARGALRRGVSGECTADEPPGEAQQELVLG